MGGRRKRRSRWLKAVHDNEEAFSGEEMRVLVAQLTTAGDISGQIQVQVFLDYDNNDDNSDKEGKQEVKEEAKEGRPGEARNVGEKGQKQDDDSQRLELSKLFAFLRKEETSTFTLAEAVEAAKGKRTKKEKEHTRKTQYYKISSEDEHEHNHL